MSASEQASSMPASAAGSSSLSHFVQETHGQVMRSLLRMRREPFGLLFALIQPVILLVFMGGAFRNIGAPLGPGGNYHAFILPGILVLTVFGNSMAGGIPLLFDKESGFLARLIAAPITRGSILVSCFVTTNLVSSFQCLLMLGLSALFGVRVASGAPGIAALLGIGLLLGFGVTMISLILAFTLEGHGDFFALLGVITLPLIFLSTAFVPIQTMPRWMQFTAKLNPLTHAIDAMRGFVIGGWDPGLLMRSSGVLALFDAAMLVLGVASLRRKL